MVIGRPVVAQMRLHAKVRAKSAARRWKAGGPQGWLAEIRRDGAPAGASLFAKRLAAARRQSKTKRLSALRPLRVIRKGKNEKTGSPGPPRTGAMTRARILEAVNTLRSFPRKRESRSHAIAAKELGPRFRGDERVGKPQR